MRMKRYIITGILVCCCMLGYGSLPKMSRQVSAMTAPSTPKGFVAKRMSKTSIRLTWKKVQGAAGYRIYRWKKATKSYRLVKKIKSASTTKWTNKKLKTNKIYAYRIRSYKKDGKKIKRSRRSYKVTCVTHKKDGEYGKPANVRVIGFISNFNQVSVGCNQEIYFWTDIDATYGHALEEQPKWHSSDPSVASVTKNGWIKVKKVGICYITARAHNGLTVSKKLESGIYSWPKSFNHVDQLGKKARNILENHHETMSKIIDILERHMGKRTTITLKNGTLITSPYLNLGGDKSTIENFLKDTKVEQIIYKEGNVDFVLDQKDVTEGRFTFYAGGLNDYRGEVVLAPHWSYNRDVEIRGMN